MSISRIVQTAVNAARVLMVGKLTRRTEGKHWPTVQVTDEGGAPLSDVPHLQPYGFGSAPPTDAVAVLSLVGGRPIAILLDHGQFRLELLPGEVALFNDKGDSVRLGTDRKITVVAGAEVVLDAPQVRVLGTLTAQSVEDSSGSMQEMRDVFNTHVHPSNGLPPVTLME